MSAENPNAAQPTTQTIVVQPRESMFGRFGKVLLVLLGIAVMVILGLSASYQSYFSDPNGPQEKYHSLSKTATNKIAILTVAGTIMEGDEFAKQQIDRIKEDDGVVGVVLRVNSPGGTVTYSDYLLHHLRVMLEERDIPLVVSMGSICASGGYYIAMAAGDTEDSIFAEPTTWTGSIGVIIPHYDFSSTIGVLGVRDDSIASGKFKSMGSPTKKMTPEERELFQTLVDETFGNFKEIVLSGRPKFRDEPEKLDEIATGQIFTADQAVENGLVDKIGFVEAAVERVAELASVSTDSVRCVKYEKQVTAMEALLGASAQPRSQGLGSELRGLLDLSTPRAYYLCTLLPALLDSK